LNLIQDKIRTSFGGHEKFVFRQGWLKKGVDATAQNGLVFTDEKALVKLGVGKNMVRSIRYWCLALGLLEEAGKVGMAHSLRPTKFANHLLADGGWDPYLEDVGTLWLLHWKMVSNRQRALVWYLTFSHYLEVEFNKKRLTAFIAKQFEHLGVHTTIGTIEREVDCCLRTYVTAKAIQGVISEDSLDCPLGELGLLRFFPEVGSYYFNIGPKVSLSPTIFGYALLNYLPGLTQNRRTVTVEECVYQPGSPGQAFKLDENSVVEYLEQLEMTTRGALRLQETAGLRQIYLDDDLVLNWSSQADQLLTSYYENH
jgi:hypothetical protein